MTNWFNVGKIVNTHGIKGEVRVISSTDFPEERFVKGNTLYAFMDQTPIQLEVCTVRQHKNFYLLTFQGYEDINKAETLKGAVLKISEEQQSALPDDEFYYHEIIGCKVYTESDECIGEVISVLSPGANDVWEVKQSSGKIAMIPYIADVVKNVDVSTKKIVIHVMEGLLD